MTNGTLQSLGLDPINISVYAKFHHKIPLSSFSHFQNLELGKASTDPLHFLGLDLVNINVSAKFYQNIPNGLRDRLLFKSYGHLPRKLSGDRHCDYRAHSESQPSASLSVDLLQVLQFLTQVLDRIEQNNSLL